MTLLLKSGPQSYGVNPHLLRAGMRNLLMIHSAELHDLCVVLGVSPEEGEPIWRALIRDGHIEQDPAKRWRPAARMRLLATARIGNPLTRAKAEALLHQALQHAMAINALPPEAPYFYVTALAVFGAFIEADKDELESLDLAWERQERPGVAFLIQPHLSALRDPSKSTRRKLRPPSSYVRLMPMQDLLSQDRTFRLVYQFTPPPPQVQEQADEGEQRQLGPDPRQATMPSTVDAASDGTPSSTSGDALRGGGKRWREGQTGRRKPPGKAS